MASGAGVFAPIRAGKLVANAQALNDFREFTLMRIVNGERRIQIAFDQSAFGAYTVAGSNAFSASRNSSVSAASGALPSGTAR